jgi:hypothetical protein
VSVVAATILSIYSTDAVAQITLPYSGSVSSSSNAFEINNTGSGNGLYGGAGAGAGVVASNNSGSNPAIYGSNNGSGAGIWGDTPNSGWTGVYGTGKHNGVSGDTGSSTSTDSGVWGNNTGAGYGVAGTASAANAAGVYGSNSKTGAVTTYGVYGIATSNLGFGVYGTSNSSNSSGVYGNSTGSGAGAGGVQGYGAGYGVSGSSIDGYGLYGASENGDGIYSYVSGSGYAGYFYGPVYVNGTISTSGTKPFMIDHPLDPANRILRHAAIESNEVKDFYDGIVTTDKAGHAVVELPQYFMSLNQKYRYQLTVMHTFAQAIVSKDIEDNKFEISTDKPNTEVSWQITGLRSDRPKRVPRMDRYRPTAHRSGR